MAYDARPWQDPFVIVGGAAAAPAGLLFETVSQKYEHAVAAPVLTTYREIRR